MYGNVCQFHAKKYIHILLVKRSIQLIKKKVQINIMWVKLIDALRTIFNKPF